MNDDEKSQPIKPSRMKKREEILNRRIIQLEGRMDKVEEMKDRMSEFVFQSVSITVGIFAMVLTIIVGFSTNWNFGEQGDELVILLLVLLFVLNLIWYFRWETKKK